MFELKDTVELMQSADYKERFIAEYQQTKIRYEKLKAFNTKIEAARHTGNAPNDIYPNAVKMPKHDCPDYLLVEQQRIMGEYLHILEVRAEIERITLVEGETTNEKTFVERTCSDCIHAKKIDDMTYECTASLYDIGKFTCFVPREE